ncbi:MAG: MFS transporter [Calothrix sp. MO_167.B42]|nr:MFS transporter [Calothrix sp. MO_167.B42]
MRYIRQLLALIRELRNFSLFWLGQSLSEIGTRLTGFGLSIWVYQNTHAVAQLSLVLFFTTLPGVLITPFVGALVDKWHRKSTIIFSEIGAAVVTVTLALLLLFGNLQLWHTYVAAFFTSICGSFQMTAKAAALPMMVPSNQIGRANGLIQFSSAVGQLAAPVFAGIIIVKLQFHSLLLIDFFSYFIGLFTLLIIDIPQPEPTISSTKGMASIIDDIIYGWGNISSRIFLMIILAFMTINYFVNGMTTVLINPLILSFSTPTIFGSVMSIAGCGMIAGSIFMSIWGGSKRSISPLFLFSALNGIALVITGLKPSIWLITLGISLSFFTLPIVLSTNNTIWQNTVHPNVQGRVLALFYTITGLGAALGNLSASPLTDIISAHMMNADGILANTIGKLVETGPGRGIGLLMVIEGLVMLFVSIILYNYFSSRHIDRELLTVDIKIDGVKIQ